MVKKRGYKPCNLTVQTRRPLKREINEELVKNEAKTTTS